MSKSKKAYHKKKYVRTRVKTKGLITTTKRALLIAAASMVLAVALFFVFYDDGSLPLKTVTVETEQGKEKQRAISLPDDERWLTINRGTDKQPKYYLVGSLDFSSGWSNDESFAVSPDKNIQEYCLRPDDTENPIDYVYIRGVPQPPEQIALSVQSQIAPMYADAIVGDIKETSAFGKQAVYFSYITKLETEGQTSQYNHTLTMYVPAKYGSAILINVQAAASSIDSSLQEEDLLAAALDAGGRLSIHE